jgi:hypothetical protein
MPVFGLMLAPAAKSLAPRLNVSALVEPSVVAAIAVNVSVVPTEMFVEERGKVREGGKVDTVLFVTVTLKLVAEMLVVLI